MPVLLVRHAYAVSRSAWKADDSLRDLSDRGRAQSIALVERLRSYEPGRILSSPLVRCMETVAPLGAALGLPVEAEKALTEGSGSEAVSLIRVFSKQTVVLCSHGDVIPEILSALAKSDGLDLGKNPKVEKGSVWVIAARKGKFSSGTYLGPPRGR